MNEQVQGEDSPFSGPSSPAFSSPTSGIAVGVLACGSRGKARRKIGRHDRRALLKITIVDVVYCFLNNAGRRLYVSSSRKGAGWCVVNRSGTGTRGRLRCVFVWLFLRLACCSREGNVRERERTRRCGNPETQKHSTEWGGSCVGLLFFFRRQSAARGVRVLVGKDITIGLEARRCRLRR